MAQMTNCAVCTNCVLSQSMSCVFYPEGIPQDIFLEYKECEHFRLEKSTDDYDDLPIAKGR